MDALFGRVAHETLSRQLHAADCHPHAMNDSLHELLPPSKAVSDALSAPIPDPLRDKLALSNHGPPLDIRSTKVLPASGRNARSTGATANPTQAQSERLLSASSPGLRQSTFCHSAAAGDVELDSGHSHAGAAGLQAGMAGPEEHSPEVKPEMMTTNSFPIAASTLPTSWPEMTHVGKLRHGEQLRQAAAEAAAAAAGQAARAESAVRLRTPPTIAFHSMAAKHAMIAAEAAAAAAAVTADSTNQGKAMGPQHGPGHLKLQSSLLEGHAQGRARQFHAPRAGRLPASAPTSPVRHGKQNSSTQHRGSHGLLDMTCQNAGCSVDLADGRVQSQHAGTKEPFGILEMSGNDVLPSAASAPASPVRVTMVGGSVQQYHSLPQQQSVQSTAAGEADACQQRVSGQAEHCKHLQQIQIAQHAQHGQQPQRAQRSQQAQHAQQATWEQEGLHPMEDPFQASEQFPVCPELPLSLPNKDTQDSQQGLLTDCTNQPQGRRCQPARLPAKPWSQQVRHADSMATRKENCRDHDRRGCNQALGMQAQLRGRTELATELLSSLTEEEFWEAARAELLDTAEPVRHKSCIGELDGVSPVKAIQLPVLASRMQHTPEPRVNNGPVQPSGITPLLGELPVKLVHIVVAMKACCVCNANFASLRWMFALSSLAIAPYTASCSCVDGWSDKTH